MIPLPKVIEFIGTVSTVVARGWRERGGELLFNGCRVLVWQDGRF